MPKTYTSVPSVSTGDVYQASTYNTYTAQNLNNLIVPPACKAVRTTAQSVNTATITAIAFTAADEFDTDSMHDTVTNNTRITVNTVGLYIVTGCINLTPNATGAYRTAMIRKNGSTELAYQNMGSGPGTGQTRINVTTIDFASAATDYYELCAYHESGGPLDTVNAGGFHAHLEVAWIGRTS